MEILAMSLLVLDDDGNEHSLEVGKIEGNPILANYTGDSTKLVLRLTMIQQFLLNNPKLIKEKEAQNVSDTN